MNLDPSSTRKTHMEYTRRELMKLALAAVPTVGFQPVVALGADRASKSTWGGVQVGIIAPYSFRGMSSNPEDMLKSIVALGLGAVELQSEGFESWAGAPGGGRGGGPGGRRGGGGRGSSGGQGNPGGAAADPAANARRDELRKWRTSTSMDKFKELRKLYNHAGVEIGLVKFGLGPSMADDEIDYAFQVAKTLGAKGITCEPPVSETRRLGQFADKHKVMIGYHGHSNVTSAEAFGRPGAWEQAFFYSKWNGANVDIGHFAAGNSVPATEFIKRYHDRITNLHLKDRKFNEGENVPWGQGDSQVREILQLMKRERYNFMATIELEYRIPEGSDTMTELARCVQFCKDALS